MFVVDGAVFEAAVQDADEAVGEGSQGLVVGVTGGSVAVVEGAGAWTGGEGGERLQVAGVGETAVAHVAGQHGAFAP